MSVRAQAFFLTARAAGSGQRFCLHHAPASGPVHAAVVYVHPFAEEMNKARRMAALQARALAQSGCAVLQIDLHGCGDSSGDFGDATWQAWLEDVLAASDWLQRRHPEAPLWLWGLRAGSLLAVQAAQRMAPAPSLLLWQPIASGRLQLQQFLRLKLAAEMMRGTSKAAMDEMRAALASGQAVEIAGYMLNPALASGLEQATLAPAAQVPRLVWLEVSGRDAPELAPASAAALQAWREAGIDVQAEAVAGPSFWQTSEIETAPALLAASCAALAAAQGVAVPA
jgi:exosortase A-associated hydrolase 2